MTARCAGLVTLLLLSIACRETTPLIRPDPVPAPAPTPAPVTGPAPRAIPPLTGPATRYVFSGPAGYPVADYTATSEVILFDNGAFGLHFILPNEFTFTGVYEQEGERINLRFSDFDGAAAMLHGDVLEVRYSDRMQQADFENAVYRRSE